MSNYNAYTTPVRLIRSFFFLIAMVLIALSVCSATSFANSNTISMNIHHQHTGGSGGGGCYTIQRSGTTTQEIPCGGTMVYWPNLGSTSCDRCGASYHGDQSHRGCWHSETISTSYTYYDLGCNMNTSTILGSFSVEPTTKEWTKSLQLQASYQVTDGVVVSDKPYIWNGQEATDQSTYTVTQNGKYSLEFNNNPNMVSERVEISVQNIDVTAPVFSHTVEPRTDWTKEGVWVTLDKVEDLQPDGSEGSGLHENPYSFDGGNTWVTQPKHLYTENGTHHIMVRDKLENTASYSVEIHNVDKEPPIIEAVEYDDTPNVVNTTVSVTASDVQPDGSEGCGLHEQPYSFDGGNTWGEEPTLNVDANGTIMIAVRDKLENTSYQEVVISNIDNFAPAISYEMVHPYWTNRDVNLYLHAEDRNADGSEGIGLEENWYSLDGGITWTNEKVQVYEENQEVTVYARDRNNNISNVHISIRQIDKDLPWVTINMEVMGEGEDKKVKLTAFGGDDYSGIHEEGYSWDKGCSYSRQQVKMVTENGVYQATVRDKAGNWNYEQIEVDVFEIPVVKEEKKKVVTPIEVEVTEEEQTSEEPVEKETETVEVVPETRVDAPKMQVVQDIEKEQWSLKDILVWLCFVLAVLGLLLFILLFLLRTMAVFAEDEQGRMRYMGRVWIHHHEGRFEVHIFDWLIEQCVTTHFNLRPGLLFVKLHKESQLCCLFPEDICMVLQVEKNIDFSLV